MSALDELHFQRRLGIVSRAQDLTESMQFDLASSQLANHELEEAVSHFNPKPQKEGWGFANVFEEMLSREPRRVPVDDLATLQNNLKNQGYLPPDHPANGIWGPDSSAAFNQFDRDNGDEVTQGNSILAGTVQDGIRFFGTMLPRSVIQGVIGTAKGIVEQAPETFERAGFGGGALIGGGLGAATAVGAAAATGAAIGTAAAPFTLGASIAVGAGIGAIAGFLGSLLDDDDEDGNGNQGILDALHPFNEGEWTTARNFAEDMGFVGSAASFLTAGGSLIGGARALLPSTLRGSLAALDPVTKPGFVMNMLASAKGSTALGVFAGGAHGLATGDDMGDIFESAAIGGVAGFAVGASPVGAKLRDIAAKRGLKRIHTNPVIKGINSVYTGGVQINVAGRYAGGFGSGEKDTAIERNIRDAPVILPEWADIIGGLVLLPTRMLPVGVGQIGSAARKMMGGEAGVARKGYFHALETAVDPATNTKYTKSKVREIVDGIEADQDLFTRRDFGIKKLTDWTLEGQKLDDAAAQARGEGKGFFARADKDALELQAKNAVIDWYNSDPENNLPLVLGMSTADDAAWTRELVAQQQMGSGVLQWPKYRPAQLRAELLGEAARQGKLDYQIGTTAAKAVDTPSFGSTGMVSEEVGFQRVRNIIREGDVESLQSGVPYKRAQALFRIVSRTMPEDEARMLGKELNALSIPQRLERLENMVPPEAEKSLIRQVAEEAKSVAVAEKPKEVTFTAATERLMTQRDWRLAKDKYIRLTEQAKRAKAAFDDIDGDIDIPKEVQDRAALAAANAADERRVFIESFRDPSNPYKRLDESVVADGLLGTTTTKKIRQVSSVPTTREEVTIYKAHKGGFATWTGASQVQAAKYKEFKGESLSALRKKIDMDLKKAGPDAVITPGGVVPGTWTAAADIPEETLTSVGVTIRKTVPSKAKKAVQTKEKESYVFADFLDEKALHAAIDVDGVSPELLKDITDNGYKLVATNEKILRLTDVADAVAVHNIGDYTKQASFFEALGVSPFKITEQQIGEIKQQHMTGMLNDASAKLGVALPGDDALHKLVDEMHSLNNAGLPLDQVAARHGPFVEVPGNQAWIRRQRFLKTDLRQLKLDDIVRALDLEGGVLTGVDDHLKAAMVYKDAIHKGAVFSGEVSLRNPADSVRMLMSAFRVQGLPGASEFARQFHITNPPRALTVAGGIAGAGIGAEEEGLKGALKGGIAGSLLMGSASYGGKAVLKHWPKRSPFKPNTYGYLPDKLFHATMAMRYSLNFFFDIGRRMEQATIASMKYGLPVTFAPKTHALRNFTDDFGGDVNAVLPGIRRELDDVMGTKLATSTEDMERGAQMVGMTGFSQRDADAVYAHYLIKQGKMNKAQIKEAVQTLGHYPARTGAERSLNFVLFPFSFQKKMLTTLNDFMLAEPARALLVHEGMRQWYMAREGDETMSSRFAELTEKYAPLAPVVGRLNNLSFGISGGRFVMEGIMNNRTLNGKITESITALFAPGGSLTPLHQAAGKAGDQMVNFFTPIFLTGEDTENFVSIFEDFSPAVRDFRSMFLGGENRPGIVSQQVTALTSIEATQQGGGGAPWYQLRAYNNEKRLIKAEFEDLASAFGYTTVDGFLNSDIGAAYRADVDTRTAALGSKYPTGLLKSQYFESSTAVDDVAKAELLSDPNRSAAEEMIAQIIEMEAEAETFGDMLGMTSDEMLPRLTQDIRSIASKWGDDARFRELFDRFFSYRYGPVAQVVV